MLNTMNSNDTKDNSKKGDDVEWILWEHEHGKNNNNSSKNSQQHKPVLLEWKEQTREVCHFFGTADPHFHCDFHHLPAPSATFFVEEHNNDASSKVQQAHTNNNLMRREYSLFKRGIAPEWEDPKNATGGCWYFHQNLQPAALDQYWHNLVGAVVDEEQLDDDDNNNNNAHAGIVLKHVNGVRVHDKSSRKHAMYKMETWVNTTDQKVKEQVRSWMMSVMTKDCHEKKHPKLHWKDFSTSMASSDHGSSAAASSTGGV